MFRSKTWLYVALALVMIFVLSSLAFAQGTPTAQLASNSQFGQILVDGKNMTLYQFTADTANTSNCTTTCIQAWPPLTVTKGTTPVAASGVTGALGTLTRADDGSTQVTMNQLPLYHFAQDKAAGDVKGQGVSGKWFVVNAAGTTVQTAVGAAAQVTGTVTATATTAPTAAATATTAPTAAATATTAPTVAPTAAASTAVTSTATAVPPSALPTTGGDSSAALLPAMLGLLAIALGGMLGLRAARQPR
jgi:predicted lipoprotein with Yx(FWY)xxD motif